MYKVGHVSATFILSKVTFSVLWKMIRLWSLVGQNITVVAVVSNAYSDQ